MMRILFIPLPVGAFGHQIMDIEQILYNLQEYKKAHRMLAFGIFLSKPANRYHSELIRSELTILPKFPFLYFHRILMRLFKSYSSLDKKIQTRGSDHYSKLSFLPMSPMAEMVSLEEEMMEVIDYFGHIPKLISFVCRDSGSDSLFGAEMSTERAYRNSSLESFSQALHYLNNEGYTIIRLGRYNLKKNDFHNLIEIQDIPSRNPDRMDFCIAKLSDFFISTGSGPDVLGIFFRKPIYFANSACVGWPRSPCIKSWLLKKVMVRKHKLESYLELDLTVAKSILLDDSELRRYLNSHDAFLASRSNKEILNFVRSCLSDYKGELRDHFPYIQY
jgi:putative glycosyltransferase (TIGR04372 family)